MLCMQRAIGAGNSSESRGNEQLTAGGERIWTLGAPGAEEGCQRHLALGALLRAGAAADLAADDQMAPAALGRVVVRWHVRFGHEDEEFLDVALDAPAQLALDRRRVSQERAADGQQLPLLGQLGNTPLPWLVIVEGFGCDIELVDCRGPPGQWRSIGVAGAQVMDVPQQVGPAALLGAIIMVVGSVAIADEYPGASIAQRLVHDAPGPRLFCPDPASGSSVRRK